MAIKSIRHLKRSLAMLASILLATLRMTNAAGQLELISRPYTNIAHVFGDSAGIELSGDGAWAAFSSNGNGLVTNDHNGLNLDVFLKNLRTGETTLVSRSLGGDGSNGDSLLTGISADGRFVVFESDADNLVADDENVASDVFLYDRDSGKITAVSRGSSGMGDGESVGGQITRNGQFILFESNAGNLAAIDTNQTSDLFCWDRQNNDLKLVTVNSNNTAAASAALFSENGLLSASVSEDGRYVAFTSASTNLVWPRVPANVGYQVYLRDMQAQTNVWVSRSATGAAGKEIGNLELAGNGSVLGFLSLPLVQPSIYQRLHLYFTASNTLVQAPVPDEGQLSSAGVTEFSLSANGEVAAYVLNGQVYRYDIASDLLLRISSAGDGSPANDVCTSPVVSDDGTVILFTSAATNLGLVESFGAFQLYRYNSATGGVSPLARNITQSGGANRDALFPVLSGDGSFAGFMSYANNLSLQDDKLANDVFVVSTSGTNEVQLASAPWSGALSASALGSSEFHPAGFSADGRRVVFSSNASEIVPGINSDQVNVFIRDLRTGQTRLVSSPDGTSLFPTAAAFLSSSRDARYIAYAATNLNGGNASRTVYVFDSVLGTNRVAAILPDGSIAASNEAFLNAEGSILAFRSTTAGANGVYVRDLPEGKTYLIGSFPTQPFALSPGGKYVAVFPTSTSLRLADWRNGTFIPLPASNYNPAQFTDDESRVLIYTSTLPLRPPASLWVYTLAAGATNLVATNVVLASISGDGSTVAAVETNSNNSMKLVIYDLNSGTNFTVSETAQAPLFRLRAAPRMNFDGRFIVFATETPLLGEEPTGFSNVYWYDRILRQLSLVSRSLFGTPGDLGSYDPAISADGRSIVFQSSATDLVANDRNLNSDVFLARLTITDSDSDALDDGWELQHFGDLQANGQEDPDFDGATNLLEFLSGTDPKNPASNFSLHALAIGKGSLRVLVSGMAGKTYQLQFRPGFAGGDWQNIGAPVTSIGGAMDWTDSAREASGFYRVRIEP